MAKLTRGGSRAAATSKMELDVAAALDPPLVDNKRIESYFSKPKT